MANIRTLLIFWGPVHKTVSKRGHNIKKYYLKKGILSMQCLIFKVLERPLDPSCNAALKVAVHLKQISENVSSDHVS